MKRSQLHQAIGAALLVAGLIGLTGCFGSWGRPDKPPGNVAWVDPATLDALDLAAARTLGIQEVFLAAGEVEWSGSTPQVRIAKLAPLRGQMPVTLVVSGQWPVALGDSKAAGTRMAEELRRLKLDAEARGLFPIGVHLDLAAAGNLVSYAQGLRAIRSILPKPLFLSVSVGRSSLQDEAVAKVARAVDYSVVFLYGQRPGQGEDTKAWDFQEVVRNVQRAEALKRPYRIGVVLLGSASHRSAGGDTLESTTEMSLRDLALNPRLKLEGGFTLEGLDREVYGFHAEGATEVGPWQVARGESVRVVGTGPTYLQSLRKRIQEVATPRYLGQVFYRLPTPTERLTPTLSQLGDALASQPPTLDILLSAEALDHNSQHWIFKVSIENRNDERSDIAMLNNNFVEVSTEGGLLGTVQAGAFPRFELLRKGSDKVDIDALRSPERLRLYLPILEGAGKLETGPIEFKPKDRNAQITLSASFLLPDGRTVVATPVVWTPTPPKAK